MPLKPSRTIDTANTRNIIATRNTRNLTSWPALVKRGYLRLFNVRSTQKNESVYVFNGAALTTDKRDGRKKRPAPFLLFVCKTRKTPRGKAHAHSSEVRRITQSPRRLLLSFCRGVSILLNEMDKCDCCCRLWCGLRLYDIPPLVVVILIALPGGERLPLPQ